MLNQDPMVDLSCIDRVDGWKLWIYTNFDCNLSCSYCVVCSTPRTPRQEIGVETAKQLIDEAVNLGFTQVFFTGGEPMLLDTIYSMLAYASERIPTTLLTNGVLMSGRRLQQLSQIANQNLAIQVSLDGGSPAPHDAYRGKGTWVKTVEGIKTLQQRGFHVKISTTQTPANIDFIDELCAFHRSLGIAEVDHIVRPLAKRGLSNEGIEVSRETVHPEITVSAQGVFWHPVSLDHDMCLSDSIIPLSKSLELIQEKLKSAKPSRSMK
jgi:MoaA/NifB/PqqE/SkfB family radical SAM enzyme